MLNRVYKQRPNLAPSSLPNNFAIPYETCEREESIDEMAKQVANPDYESVIVDAYVGNESGTTAERGRGWDRFIQMT